LIFKRRGRRFKMATTASLTEVLPLDRLAMRMVRCATISEEFDFGVDGDEGATLEA
jgi:hypothetical protein